MPPHLSTLNTSRKCTSSLRPTLNIKNVLRKKTKAPQIFDLLVKYGLLTRTELATIVGINPGSHSFSYGLLDLKTKGYVEAVSADGKGKKLRLTDKAFLNALDDRPEAIAVDEKVIEDGAKKIEANKKKKSSEDEDGGSKKKKVPKKTNGKSKRDEGSDSDNGDSDAFPNESESKKKGSKKTKKNPTI
jgi:hypothetical protein